MGPPLRISMNRTFRLVKLADHDTGRSKKHTERHIIPGQFRMKTLLPWLLVACLVLVIIFVLSALMAPTWPGKPPSTSITSGLAEQRLRNLESGWTLLQTVLGGLAVSLTVLTLFIAVLGAVGWAGISRFVSQEVSRAMTRTTEELSGRLIGMEGVVWGLLCRNEKDEIVHRDWLDKAILLTQRSRTTLEKFERSEYSWRSINNLAYYYSLRKDPGDAREALALAEELRHNASKIGRREVLRTYADVASIYHRSAGVRAHELLEDAQELMRSMLGSPDLRPRERPITERALEHVENAIRDLDLNPIRAPHQPKRPSLVEQIKRFFGR